MMIRFAQNGDHPQLKALWAEAFGDSPAEIDRYFALRHRDADMLVVTRDKALIGMLSMLPLTLCAGDAGCYRARYCYAVAVAARERGQGIGTALLEAAHAHMKKLEEAASLLVPASPGLFSYYGRHGYTTAFYQDVAAVDASALPPFPGGGKLSPCSAAEYTRVRDQAFQRSRLYACWEEKAVSFALSQFEYTGGATALSWPGGYGCAAWETTDAGILVRELALPEGNALTALSVLHQTLQAGQYTVRLAQGVLPGTVSQPFGMVRWLIPAPAAAGTPPYLSLAMD